METAYYTTLISASVSLLIFSATQWWTYMKSNHDFLRQRLEEAMSGYRSMLTELKTLERTERVAQEADQIYFRLYACMNKPDLLLHLYFPDLNALRGKIFSSCLPMLEYYRGAYTTDKNPPPGIGTPVVKRISEAVMELQDHILADHDNLTKNPERFFRNR
jgi:hypothetical protein